MSRYRKYSRRDQMCYFCVEDAKINYKDVDTLRRYITARGKIRPRHRTGVCSKHQRLVAKAIKRARHMALLPFVAEIQHI